MTKSELIEALAKQQPHLAIKDVELAVKCIIEKMNTALAAGERIEIRGFGSFSLHMRPPRMGRNPKTGESVALAKKYVPHFKPGKELRDRVDASREKCKIVEPLERPIKLGGFELEMAEPSLKDSQDKPAKAPKKSKADKEMVNEGIG